MSTQLRFISAKDFQKNQIKYRGFTIFTLDDKVFPIKKASYAKKYFDLIRNKYNKIPTIEVIPKADILILNLV